MTDTRVLIDKITAFRQRLESMPRLVPQPQTEVAAPPAPVATAADELETKVRAGSRTQAILESSLRQLAGLAESPDPCPGHLTARAKRLLGEARAILQRLRMLADDPLLAGPPARADGSAPEIDPLAFHFRETAALLESAVRLASTFPDTATVQLRLCDGIDSILELARRRFADLQEALTRRARDAQQADTLAHLLTALDAGQQLHQKPFADLASAILADEPAGPLGLLGAEVTASQAYLGGPAFPAPARFVACHALTTARVMARLVHNDPVWRSAPLAPVVAALLHDVGMLRVPVELLNTTGPLSDEQRRVVEGHAAAGAELVTQQVPTLAMLGEPIAHHHERSDGTGYPGGLKEDSLSSLARLLAVADVYAAFCCPRPHRDARDPRTALTDTLLLAERGQLDRGHAQKLLKLALYPVGSVVELSDGAVGVVVANHSGKTNLTAAARPVLALLTDADKRILPTARHLDLAETDHGLVVRTLGRSEREKFLARHYPQFTI